MRLRGSQEQTVTLKNIGDAPLTIEQIAWLTGGIFTASDVNLPATLEVDETLTVTLTFLGDSDLGLASDSLQIETDVQAALTLEVRAEVSAAPALRLYKQQANSLIPLDFEIPFDMGHVVLGQQKEAQLVVLNE